MIGLDTTAIIDLFYDNSSLKSLLAKLDEEIVVSVINYQEIMFGLDFRNKNFAEEEFYYDEMFDQFSFFDLTKDCCKRSSEIFNELLKKGQIIEKFDCVIAGIYLSNGVSKIITRNKKHFEKIRDIEVISY